MKRTHVVWLSLFFFSLLSLSSCKDRLFDNPLDPAGDKKAYEILTTFPTPQIIPVDLTFSGESLWVVDTGSRLLSLNYNSGALIRELQIEQSPAGVAYDGDGLWITLKNISQVLKINMQSGSVLQQLNLPHRQYGCLDFFDRKLYIADSTSNAILVVDPKTGEIEKTLSNPGFSLDGVAFDGTNLWTIDSQQMRIYRLSPEGTVQFYYQTPAKSTSGICYSNKIFWCGDQSGRIFQLRFQ